MDGVSVLADLVLLNHKDRSSVDVSINKPITLRFRS